MGGDIAVTAPHPSGTPTEPESAYKELDLDVISPPARERPANQLILDKFWVIIDKLRRMGNPPLTIARWMGHEIKSSFAADSTQRAANATSTIESHLSNGAPKEAWRALKGWYRVVEDRPAPACPKMMEGQMAERVELYDWAPPMGVALPFNFLHFPIPDGVPADEEIHAVVVGLKNGQATGATGMRVEHVKAWLGNIRRKEKAARENPGKTANMGELRNK
jgi:hypothetical protein